MNKRMTIFASAIFSFLSFLSFSMDQSILPKELIMTIGIAHDDARDVLAKTCRLYHQKFSINSSELINLINHPSFHTNKKNIQWLSFNAAWKSDFQLLKSIMRHMEQSDYLYQYPLADEHDWYAKFDLGDIVKNKMPNEYNDISNIARNYGCEIDCYNNWREWDDLTMACYNKDDQRVRLLLFGTHYITDLLDTVMFIAIDKNSDKCINALLLYSKNHGKNITASFSNFERYKSFIRTAMKNGKDKAFEAVVSNDVFGCLNYKDCRNKTMLDHLVDDVEKAKQADGKKYIDIYRKYGGKTFDELHGWGDWSSCITQ